MYYHSNMTHYNKLLLINSLDLPKEVCNKIQIEYKYNNLQKTFDERYINLVKHINYYSFLNIKINKRHKRRDTLLKTIKFFD